jgi:hypothetical protein
MTIWLPEFVPSIVMVSVPIKFKMGSIPLSVIVELPAESEKFTVNGPVPGLRLM